MRTIDPGVKEAAKTIVAAMELDWEQNEWTFTAAQNELVVNCIADLLAHCTIEKEHTHLHISRCFRSLHGLRICIRS
jgi:hypothetical protein